MNWLRTIANGEDAESLNGDDSCNSWERCGGCDDCHLMQAAHYGHEILPEYESHIFVRARMLAKGELSL